MGYRTLRDCINDLERHRQLLRIDVEVDARLEAAEIHRRVCAAGGPALLFTRVRGCRFPMVSNLFGTIDRARFMFRDSLERVRRLVELKLDPTAALRHPLRYAGASRGALTMVPRFVRRAAVTANETTISQLPQQVSWPEDGGAFITLPQVYTEDVRAPGWRRSNLGMYRVQLSGGRYEPDREVGLHYQIHRSIGVHHAAAIEAGKPFRVNIFVGGPPAMMLAAVLPLPEGMSELAFAGALGGRRVRMFRPSLPLPSGEGGERSSPGEGALPIHTDTDFCICGTVVPDKLLPEGPFGDHLGYYSLQHDFPVLRVERVFHRNDSIWPFTVVGRPPQEDTIFGQLIHELTGPVIPSVLPGVVGVHAVDAAGVHPLLLAIGSERYWPFAETQRPQELLTQANAILGQGQLSLAKFLLIANQADDPQLALHDVAAFVRHILERADWTRDLHFQTETTIDTLDYSGGSLNTGSKVVIAAVGPKRFDLANELPPNLRLPEGFTNPRIALPGVLAIEGPRCDPPRFQTSAANPQSERSSPAAAGNPQLDHAANAIERFCSTFSADDPIRRFRLLVIVDDSQFVTESLRNFLWVTFTRANPAANIHGIDSFIHDKHWGCRGPLVIDARLKPHHAPPLVEDPEVSRRVDALAAPGGPLHGVI
ncbi:MAG TPA: UbiD family decarboxylase [Lacipirellulaceae bacterium]|jgi:4-hydroxy-3-polyprenylbenzoate decarboxylase|nr:UbiD family decarboxylase [Lacipirellulaceae bacterium]